MALGHEGLFWALPFCLLTEAFLDYYTDNVHHARLNSLGKLFEKAVLQISYDGKVVPGMSLASLRGSVHKNIHVDMDERACAEALTDLDAYYKVNLPPDAHAETQL